MKHALAAWVGLMMFVGCSGQTQTWEVAAHREPCQGASALLCMVVQRSSDSDPGFEYSGVVGFTPAWGHSYTIDVDISDVDNPPADGSSERVTLRTVRRDTPVAIGTTFRFDIFTGNGGDYLSLTGTDRGQLLDGTPFTCPTDPDVCGQIAARLTSGEPFAIIFAHATEGLTATAVENSTGASAGI